MSEGVERHLEVTRTARYCVLGEELRTPAEVWFVLHGYGQLARRFLRRFEPVADGSRIIVAPEALSRFYASSDPGRHGPTSVVGATWMTREDRLTEIDDYVRYLDRLAARTLDGLTRAPRVTVLGFSQGVATAARWSVRGSIRPARLVLWGDFLPPDLDLARAAERWATVDVVAVRGSRDGVVRAGERARSEETAARAAGVKLRYVAYDGGHEVYPAALEALTGGHASGGPPSGDSSSGGPSSAT